MSNLSTSVWRAWAKADTSPDEFTLQAAIDAAEEAVNDHCARQFIVAEAVTTSARLFVPRGDDILRFDDAAEVVSITVNGSLVDSSLYQLEPVNGRNSSGLAVPYEEARLIGSVWPCDYGRANVSVVARWGWDELPARYYQAVKDITKVLAYMTEIPAVIDLAEFDGVLDRLSRLRRVESWGIA